MVTMKSLPRTYFLFVCGFTVLAIYPAPSVGVGMMVGGFNKAQSLSDTRPEAQEDNNKVKSYVKAVSL